MTIFGTKQVAKILGVGPHVLTRAIWEDRVDPPNKGPGGAFCWTKEDIIRAGWVLFRRDVSEDIGEIINRKGKGDQHEQL